MIRGEIWWADFGIPSGSEPGFYRPVLVVQTDSVNQSKINTTIVVPFTTNLLLESAPGNVFVDKDESKLSKDSVLVVSQISVINKSRLIKYENKVLHNILDALEDGLKLILEIK